MNADAGTRGTDNSRPASQDRGTDPDLEARPTGLSTARVPLGQKKAGRVLLLDKGLVSVGQPYNLGHLNGEAQIRLFTSWDEMAGVLKEYASISELTILGHGSPGGFWFSQGGRETSLSLLDTTAWYQSHSAVKRPRVKVIHLQSCNIGLNPSPLVGFAKLYQASKITAWNHFYVCNVETLDIPRGADKEQITKTFGFREYLVPGVNLEDLVKRPGRHKVLLEWFRVAFDKSPLPPVPAGFSSTYTNPARKHFKPTVIHKERIVSSPAELKELSEELREFGFVEPEKPLLKITIELDSFSDGKPNLPDAGALH